MPVPHTGGPRHIHLDNPLVPPHEEIAGRSYARAYRTSGKADLHSFLENAVERSSGRLLYSSSPKRAPVYFGVKAGEERLGLLAYPFRCTGRIIRNRPGDEHRAQIRLGAEPTWEDEHPLAIDEAGIDVTLVLGVHLEAGIIIGLDPLLYDPLPMGISIEFKTQDVESTLARGWHVWQRPSRAGTRRERARSESGMETVIAFRPDRFLAFARFERQASSLSLDPLLRMRAAQAAASEPAQAGDRHLLEETFHLSSEEILEIIGDRKRLRMAVRGGVAEHHLLKTIAKDPAVLHVEQVDADGPPDVIATLTDGRVIRVECKNGEEHAYADGSGRVEVQKTRASKGDPASRYYKPAQFDVLAVCLWPDEGPPRFVYRPTRDLARHKDFPDRIGVMHRIDESWARRLVET